MVRYGMVRYGMVWYGMYGCMHVCMYGCMDVWMYGYMDEWMDGCMYLCMYVLYCIVLYCIVLYCIVLYCMQCIVLYCNVMYVRAYVRMFVYACNKLWIFYCQVKCLTFNFPCSTFWPPHLKLHALGPGLLSALGRMRSPLGCATGGCWWFKLW